MKKQQKVLRNRAYKYAFGLFIKYGFIYAFISFGLFLLISLLILDFWEYGTSVLLLFTLAVFLAISIPAEKKYKELLRDCSPCKLKFCPICNKILNFSYCGKCKMEWNKYKINTNSL